MNHETRVNLETERLRLRQWEAGDFEAIARFYADAANARYVGGRMNRDEAWRNLALQIGHWQLKGFGYWAVDEKKSGAFAGCVGLWQSPGWPELELGYWLQPEYQGKGYAGEAARKCLTFARETLRAPSLVSYIAPTNAPSIKLAEKLGARYEKTIELLTHGTHRVYRYF